MCFEDHRPGLPRSNPWSHLLLYAHHQRPCPSTYAWSSGFAGLIKGNKSLHGGLRLSLIFTAFITAELMHHCATHDSRDRSLAGLCILDIPNWCAGGSFDNRGVSFLIDIAAGALWSARIENSMTCIWIRVSHPGENACGRTMVIGGVVLPCILRVRFFGLDRR